MKKLAATLTLATIAIAGCSSSPQEILKPEYPGPQDISEQSLKDNGMHPLVDCQEPSSFFSEDDPRYDEQQRDKPIYKICNVDAQAASDKGLDDVSMMFMPDEEGSIKSFYTSKEPFAELTSGAWTTYKDESGGQCGTMSILSGSEYLFSITMMPCPTDEDSVKVRADILEGLVDPVQDVLK